VLSSFFTGSEGDASPTKQGEYAQDLHYFWTCPFVAFFISQLGANLGIKEGETPAKEVKKGNKAGVYRGRGGSPKGRELRSD
jgi:hypothetical protein